MVVVEPNPDDGEGVIMLGRELAAARAVEEQHVRLGPSPIAGVTYPDEAGCGWRWTDQPVDDVMSAFVARYVRAHRVDQGLIRSGLSMRDLTTVNLFAWRRAFAAMRAQDPMAVVEAFDALSAIELARVDWRDVSVAAMLACHGANLARVGPGKAMRGALQRAEPALAQVLAAALEPEDNTSYLEACGYQLVDTPDGLVLLNDDLDPYRPETDLIPIALTMAQAIDAEGSYKVHDVTTRASIDPHWLGGPTNPSASGAVANVTGCLIISAHHPPTPGPEPGHHQLKVFLAEATNSNLASDIAAAAEQASGANSVRIAAATKRLCAFATASCHMNREPSIETPATMQRFQPLLVAALTDPALQI